MTSYSVHLKSVNCLTITVIVIEQSYTLDLLKHQSHEILDSFTFYKDKRKKKFAETFEGDKFSDTFCETKSDKYFEGKQPHVLFCNNLFFPIWDCYSKLYYLLFVCNTK